MAMASSYNIPSIGVVAPSESGSIRTSNSFMSASTSAVYDMIDEDGMEWMKSSHFEYVAYFVLVGRCKEDASLVEPLKEYSLDVFYSNDGSEYKDRSFPPVAFVLNDFNSPIFRALNGDRRTIFGVPFVKKCLTQEKRLRFWPYPIFTGSMEEVVVCFTGFKEQNALRRLVDLVHFMGGNVRKAVTTSVTHLVAATTQGEKYRLAAGLGIPIMSADWVYSLWENRDITFLSAKSSEFSVSKLPAFFGLKLAFGDGFPVDEIKTMEEKSKKLGAELVDRDQCTHYVVPTGCVSATPRKDSKMGYHMVTAEWWTVSVSLGVCANSDKYHVGEKGRKRLGDSLIGGDDEDTPSKKIRRLGSRSSTMIDIPALNREQSFPIGGESVNIRRSSRFSRRLSCPSGIEISKTGASIAKAMVSDLGGIFAKNADTILTLGLYDGFIEVTKSMDCPESVENRGIIVLDSIHRIVNIVGAPDGLTMFALTIRHSVRGDYDAVFQFHNSGNLLESGHLAAFEQKENFLNVLYHSIYKPSGGEQVQMSDHIYSDDDSTFDMLLTKCIKRAQEIGGVWKSMKKARRSSNRLVRSLISKAGRRSSLVVDGAKSFNAIAEEMQTEK